MIEPQSRTANVNGINIHYWDWKGEGPAIVMLHPSHGFGRMWDFLARQLQPEYRVLCPDQRGHGDSDKPATGYAGEDYAADLDALTTELGLKKVVLLGHSLGSRVSLIFAAQHPDRVSHVIMVGGPHFVSIFTSDSGERARVDRRLQEIEGSRIKYSSVQEALESFRAPTSRYRTLSEEALRHIVTHNMNHKPDGSVEWKWDTRAVVQTMSHIPDDLKPYIERITCPVLIPWGVINEDITPERVPLVKPFFPTAQWVFMKEVRHRMYMDDPETFAKVIREFLAR